MPLRRRLRGVLVATLLWAALWGVAGALLGVAVAALGSGIDHEGPRGAELVAFCAVMFATLGASAGFLFAASVATLERRRSLAQLRAWRAGLLGGVASALASLQAFDEASIVAGVAVFGGMLAATSVKLAQGTDPPAT